MAQKRKYPFFPTWKARIWICYWEKNVMKLSRLDRRLCELVKMENKNDVSKRQIMLQPEDSQKVLPGRTVANLWIPFSPRTPARMVFPICCFRLPSLLLIIKSILLLAIHIFFAFLNSDVLRYYLSNFITLCIMETNTAAFLPKSFQWDHERECQSV